VEPFRLILMPTLQASFVECMSPNFQSFQPVEIWLLAMIALGFTTGIRLPAHRLLLLLALCHMALAHMRHAELLASLVRSPQGPHSAPRLPRGFGRCRVRRWDRGLRVSQRRPTCRRSSSRLLSPSRRVSPNYSSPSDEVTIASRLPQRSPLPNAW